MIRTTLLIVLLIASSLLSLDQTQSQDFFNAPKSSVYFSGYVFPLYCQLNEESVQYIWRVGMRFGVGGIEGAIVYDILGNRSILELLFSQALNGTIVQCCYPMSDGFITCSHPAVMTVQGRPDPVTSLSVTSNFTSLSVTWDPVLQNISSTNPPPGFSLKEFKGLRFNSNIDTGVYYNVTVSLNGSQLTSQVVNTSSFSFTLMDRHDCSSVYNFTVIAINVVGESDGVTEQKTLCDDYQTTSDVPSTARPLTNASTAEPPTDSLSSDRNGYVRLVAGVSSGPVGCVGLGTGSTFGGIFIYRRWKKSSNKSKMTSTENEQVTDGKDNYDLDEQKDQSV